MNQFHAAALRLAGLGWYVMPLRAGRKEPATPHGCLDASREAKVINEWWRRWPAANLGVATGAGSGIVVVDVDGPAGAQGWAELELEHGLVETLVQETGRPDGGRQLFFLHPGDGKVPCRTGWRPGLDCRGDGGYVVVPPSVHPSGKRYRWLSKGSPAPLPDWLLELLVAKKVAPAPAPPSPRVPRPPSAGTTAWGKARLDAQTKAVAEAAEGTRNATLNVAAFRVGQGVGAGEIDEDDARAELVSAAAMHAGVGGWTEQEALKTIESGLSRGREEPRGPRSRPKAAPAKGSAEEPVDETFGAWRSALLLSGKDVPHIRAVLPNAVVLVRHHPAWKNRLVFDSRHLRAEWLKGPPWNPGGEPRPLLEGDAVEASRWFGEVEEVAFSSDILWTVLVTEAQRHPVDRVRAYLEGLVWDEVPRIASWLVDLLGAEPRDDQAADWPEYIKAVGAAWLISAVARAMRPGVQADHMLVLEGPQGTLKSSSLAALGGPYYAELALDVEARDALMGIHGPWIVEWSELAGLGRREAEAVKAFLSRRTDRFRPPYGRHVDDYPRSCVFAGTTNESMSLTDATGNRRYWPVRVSRARPEAVEAARDQLWAEAVFRWNCGEHWWLTPDLEHVARAQQEARLERDAWEEPIAYALDHGNLQSREFVTTGDLFSALQLGAAQQTTGSGRRLSRVMESLGWRAARGMSDEGRRRGYVRPGVVVQLRAQGVDG